MTTQNPHRQPSVSPPSPALDEARVLHLLDAELSPRARLATTALLLVALIVTIAVASLWLTEPVLPLRTHLAFGLIVVAGLGWSGYFGRVLLHRQTPYSGHRIAAATLGAFVSALFAAAALVLATMQPQVAAVAIGAAMPMLALLVAAVWLRQRAVRQRAALIARRDQLAAELGMRTS